MSLDPKGGDPANPQSWNRYAYVQGNPIKMNDPTGMVGEVQIEEALELAEPLIEKAEEVAEPYVEAAAEKGVELAEAAVEKGGAAVVKVGQAGEAAVRAVADIGKKVAIKVADRVRIPDGLTETVLSEVKNVVYQPFTQQLRDFASFASENGLRFDLWVRSSVTLSGPLQAAAASGAVNVRPIP